MKNEQDLDELKRDRMDEDRQEIAYEKLMVSNEEYCIEQHGLADVHNDLEKMAKSISEYGHEISTSDLIDLLKEI